jgi:hypothetical protein
LIALMLSLAWGGPVGVASPDRLAEARAPRRVALLFGVDSYDDPELVDLRFAAKDASDLGRALADPDIGDFDRVVEVTGSPKRQDLLDALEQVVSTLHADDTLLVFFAGHGTMRLSGGETELFLLPADAELDRPQEAGLALSELERLLQSVRPRRRVLIIDACYNGEGRSALSSDTSDILRSMRGEAPQPTLLDLGRMDARLFAARPTDPAIESQKLGNGVYTHFLVQALEGEGDVDGDGLVDVHEAHEWARDRTLRYTDGLQVPWIRIDEQGRLPIWLAGDPDSRAQATRAILTGLESLPTSTVMMVDGVPRGGGGLEPGWHRIEVRVDEQLVVDRAVHARPARRVAVETLVAQSQSSVHMEAGLGWQPSQGGGLRNPWVGQARLSWWPVDPGMGRPAFDLQAGGSIGPVAGLESLPTADAQLGVRWSFGQRVRVGPRFHAGGLWRFTEQGTQVGPVAGGSLVVQVGLDRWHLAIEGGVLHPLLAVDGVQVWQPSATAMFGVRL